MAGGDLDRDGLGWAIDDRAADTGLGTDGRR